MVARTRRTMAKDQSTTRASLFNVSTKMRGLHNHFILAADLCWVASFEQHPACRHWQQGGLLLLQSRQRKQKILQQWLQRRFSSLCHRGLRRQHHPSQSPTLRLRSRHRHPSVARLAMLFQRLKTSHDILLRLWTKMSLCQGGRGGRSPQVRLKRTSCPGRRLTDRTVTMTLGSPMELLHLGLVHLVPG